MKRVQFYTFVGIISACPPELLTYSLLEQAMSFFHMQAVTVTMARMERNHWLTMSHCWHALILWSQLNAFALQWLSDLASKMWVWSTDRVVFALWTAGLLAPVNTGVTRKCLSEQLLIRQTTAQSKIKTARDQIQARYKNKNVTTSNAFHVMFWLKLY